MNGAQCQSVATQKSSFMVRLDLKKNIYHRTLLNFLPEPAFLYENFIVNCLQHDKILLVPMAQW